MDDYESYDGIGLAECVARGEATAEALLEAAVERLEKRDPGIGSVVVPLVEEARAAVADGLPDGPFRGVPFLVKDLHLHMDGVRLTNGSRMWADYVSDHDSVLVERYRRAGFAMFGRTHSPEFGLTTTTETRLFGQTRNPWNREHTSGGSSGGASAAVAAGLVPLANASDGGGSIRIPASCCGLFGLKPTRARTPMGPDAGEGWSGMSSVHAVSRSVRDSAALLDASCGEDLGAPYWCPPRARPFLEEVGADPGRLRIALQTEPFNGAPIEPDCVAAAEDAAELCRSLGHEVVPAKVDFDADALRGAGLVIICANLRSTLLERAEALGRELVADDVEPGAWVMAQLAASRSAADYAGAVRTIHATGRAVARFFEDYDLLLTPTMAAPPARLGVLSLSNPDGEQSLAALNQSVGFTQLFNASGNPAASVPLSWNDAGLPIGVQLAARFGDEATIFRLAAQLEEARPWFERRAPGLASDS